MFETFLTILAVPVFLFCTFVLFAAGTDWPGQSDPNMVLKVLLTWAVAGAWLVAAVISNCPKR